MWLDALLAAEAPAAVVNTLDRSLSDPQVLHRNMVLAMTAPEGKHLRVAGNPIKFVGESEPDYTYPPHLGADNRSVLSDVLGLSEGRIDQLQRKLRQSTFGKAWSRYPRAIPQAISARVNVFPW